MTLAELQTKANTKLAAFWDALAIKQEAYHLKHDDYFQLIVSPTLPVVDGADSDFTVIHPDDQIYQVDVDFAWVDKIPFQIAVTPWGNDIEKGYKAIVLVEVPDGRRFTRSRSLTDTRVLTQDFDNTDLDNPVPLNDPHYVGTDPLIETTAWTEVIDEEI